MKVWLYLIAVTAGVLLMFCALRAKPTVTSSQIPRSVSEVDPTLEELRAGSSRASIANDLSQSVGQFDESNVATAAAFLEGLRESDHQRDLARELLTRLFENDPASAAELVAALHEPLQMQMAAALASLWGEKDPQSAAEWVKKLPSSPARTHALLSLCGDWAALDPQSAANFVINAPVSDFPTRSATSTESTVTNAPGSDVRSQTLFIIGNHWAAKASGEAIISVSQVPDGANRDSLIAGIASTLAESSPSDAARLVASITPGRQQNDAALTVLLEWGRSDPEAAANWLKLFPSGEFRDKAIQSLTATLAQREPDSANNVLLDWPVTDERTSAIRYYLNETLDTDASRGVSVLAGIQDGPLFQEETERVAQHWLMQQPSVALEWLSETDLEDSTKMRLLSAPGLAVPSPF